MKMTAAILCAAAICAGGAHLPANAQTIEAATTMPDESQQLIDLSREKWLWMANLEMERLEALFHPSARFVHMSRTMDRAAELEVIRSGGIHYKQADISEISVEMIGDTAIVYSKLRLIAVVGGNEVTNPFSATEVYVRHGAGWQLASLAFSRLVGD